MNHDVVNLAKHLITLSSENPNGREINVSNFIKEILKEEGFKVKIDRVEEDRENILATPSEISKIKIIFSGHMDTVNAGAGWTVTDPFTPKIIDDYLYGRGACDMKGGLAAMISAGIKAASQGVENFGLIFTVDEECGLKGAKSIVRMVKGLKVKGWVVGEPTGLRLALSHKGLLRMTFQVKGRAAHTSVAEKGVNAIHNTCKIIHAVTSHIEKIEVYDDLLGRPTSQFTKIEGGEAENIVPEECTAKLDIRLVPPMNPNEIATKLTDVAVSSVEEECKVKVSVGLSLPPHKISADSWIAKILLKVLKRLELNERIIGVPYYTEAQIYSSEASVPALIIGPGDIHDAHRPNEKVSVKQLLMAEKIYLESMREANGTD